jgi:hypothetical protein
MEDSAGAFYLSRFFPGSLFLVSALNTICRLSSCVVGNSFDSLLRFNNNNIIYLFICSLFNDAFSVTQTL